jgi:DNA-binding response OmpR family regulator
VKILILDEDPVVVDCFYSMVEAKYGSQVDIYATTSPEIALGVTDSYLIDLAFLNIRMPNIDGYDFMRMINGRLRGVKFVTAVRNEISDIAGLEEREKCTIIDKPIKAKKLLDEVDTALTDWMLQDIITALRQTRAYCGSIG